MKSPSDWVRTIVCFDCYLEVEWRSMRGAEKLVAGVPAKVAIKVISLKKSKDVKHQELFVQEAKMSSHLRHQNLTQIQDFDRQGDIYFW